MTEADRQRQHVTVAYTATLRRPNDNGLIFSAQEFSGRRRFIFGPLSTMTAFQINVNGAQMDPLSCCIFFGRCSTFMPRHVDLETSREGCCGYYVHNIILCERFRLRVGPMHTKLNHQGKVKGCTRYI